jgi:hypothetical protein
MQRTLLSFVAVAALAFCAEKTYTVTLFSPATAGNTELQPGTYKVQIVDQKAILLHGKSDARIAVTVETEKEKFNDTSVRIDKADGKARLQEIRLGGTNTKLVIAEPATSAAN